MIFVWWKNSRISAFLGICNSTMILSLILQVLSNSIHGLVCNTSQRDFCHQWWFQKVDLMRDFFGAFFNLCGLKPGEYEIAPFLLNFPCYRVFRLVKHRLRLSLEHLSGWFPDLFYPPIPVIGSISPYFHPLVRCCQNNFRFSDNFIRSAHHCLRFGW